MEQVLETKPSQAQNLSSSSSTAQEVPARILKKRESDRRCQRIKRERTKSKIAALEDKVRSLGDQDHTGQIRLLMKQLQDVERERDDLAKKVKTIESVIRDEEVAGSSQNRPTVSHKRSSSAHATPSLAESSEQDGPDAAVERSARGQGPDSLAAAVGNNVGSASQGGPNISHPAMTFLDDTPPSMVRQVNANLPTRTPQHPSTLEHRIRPSVAQSCDCCCSRAEQGMRFNTWRFANEVLSSRFTWPEYFQLLPDNYLDDTPVRVVVEDWSVIESRGEVHPSWSLMKQIDQVIFSNAGPKERLAALYGTQLCLMSHVCHQELPQLPGFYKKRPSQSLADSYAIHFFPWPGVRERFVFNQHRYCSNEFWNSITRDLRIIWPYELRDCYMVNVETGRYSLSPLFIQHVNDLRCWSMDSDFFIKWPEMRADIPVFNSIPPTMSSAVQSAKQQPTLSQPVKRRESEQQPEATVALDSTNSSVQMYSRPETMLSAPIYNQFTAYSAGGNIMPLMTWPPNSSQQTQENFGFYSSVTNTVEEVVDSAAPFQ